MSTLSWLAGIWLSAFTSATILPGNSEAVFAAALHFQPQLWLLAWLVVSIGNILGGLLTIFMGRKLLRAPDSARHAQWLQAAQRYGPISLLFSWVPLLGDALCGLAGYCRWPWFSSVLYLSAGKIARYGVIVWVLI
ncbi:YqaA family protein [Chitinibacter sp. S2-10]|uniref:YqaA family protein n=1 Tax=Chitinibacter sp. S2-10 TaxID=3373597 RepID=UPI003977DD0D